MSKSLVPERGVRKPAATPQPKLAGGPRDISSSAIKVARGTRDMTPLVALENDDDTIVVDTDPNLADELVLEADADVSEVGEVDGSDVAETSEVTESQASVIDARMLE